MRRWRIVCPSMRAEQNVAAAEGDRDIADSAERLAKMVFRPAIRPPRRQKSETGQGCGGLTESLRLGALSRAVPATDVWEAALTPARAGWCRVSSGDRLEALPSGSAARGHQSFV
jgi:hypothetical protein